MKELAKDAAKDVADLLLRFSFDLNGFSVEQLANHWLSDYPANWVRFALIEALYQGRYKAFSVERILRLWNRRGQPLYHFNHEFERIIRGRFSKDWLTYPTPRPARKSPAPISSTVIRSTIAESTAELTAESTIAESNIAESNIAESTTEPVAEPTAEPTVVEQSPSELTFAEFDPVNPDSAAMEATHNGENLSAQVESDLAQFQDIDSSEESEEEPEFTEVDLTAPSELTSSETDEDQPPALTDRLQLLSSEESIAFLKLRIYENHPPCSAKEVPIQTFKPFAEEDDSAMIKLKGLNIAANHPPVEEIHQFVPRSASPTFYSKLKAVVTASAVTSSGPETEAAERAVDAPAN